VSCKSLQRIECTLHVSESADPPIKRKNGNAMQQSMLADRTFAMCVYMEIMFSLYMWRHIIFSMYISSSWGWVQDREKNISACAWLLPPHALHASKIKTQRAGHTTSQFVLPWALTYTYTKQENISKNTRSPYSHSYKFLYIYYIYMLVICHRCLYDTWVGDRGSAL
jgi:hypothetical protein